MTRWTAEHAAGKGEEQPWDLVMEPEARLFDLRLRELWQYRDLLWLFVRRDLVAVYKQTVLGPLWFFLQPLLTTVVFTVIFAGVAKLPTNGTPPMLFYLAGTVPWNYFAACLQRISNTFIHNAGIFGKVYFPRLVVPVSVVISTLIQFLIQMLLFACIWGWYLVAGKELDPQWWLIPVMTPVLLLLMGALGLGSGILVSALTTKYRDFTFLVTFGVQLLMYATPVIYPLSMVSPRWKWLVELNPMTAPVEAFRAIYLGGTVPWTALGLSVAVTLGILCMGTVIFNRVERTFMDTV